MSSHDYGIVVGLFTRLNTVSPPTTLTDGLSQYNCIVSMNYVWIDLLYTTSSHLFIKCIVSQILTLILCMTERVPVTCHSKTIITVIRKSVIGRY